MFRSVTLSQNIYGIYPQHWPFVAETRQLASVEPEELDAMWAEGWRHFGTQFFRSRGLHVPEIYGKDDKAGVYLQEDLGDLALFDLEEILLLGTSAWNSDHLVEQAGEYIRNAIFVDGFFNTSFLYYLSLF